MYHTIALAVVYCKKWENTGNDIAIYMATMAAVEATEIPMTLYPAM